MRNIELVVEIENNFEKQRYNCNGVENKDIIRAKNDLVEFIYDRKIAKLMKKEERNTVSIDFSNKNINIIDRENTISFKINVSKYFVSDNILRATYNIDDNIFQIFIEIKYLD